MNDREKTWTKPTLTVGQALDALVTHDDGSTENVRLAVVKRDDVAVLVGVSERLSG